MKAVLAILAAFHLAWLLPARADSAYPARPVRVVVPFPAGGPTDSMARIISERIESALRRPFVIDNRPGATGMIGTNAVAKALPDGHTLLFTSNTSLVIAPLLQPSEGAYSNLVEELQPLSMVMNYPFLLVVGKHIPAATVPELIAYAKAHPGALNFGTPGPGSGGHLITELFVKTAGIQAVHVPYRGVPAIQAALIAGELAFAFDTLGAARPLLEFGAFRALAVTGNERSPLAPTLPTLKELGLTGFDPLLWMGFFAPRATPPSIVEKLAATMEEVKRSPSMSQRIAELAASPGVTSPAAFEQFIRMEIPAWSAIVAKTGVKLPN